MKVKVDLEKLKKYVDRTPRGDCRDCHCYYKCLGLYPMGEPPTTEQCKELILKTLIEDEA